MGLFDRKPTLKNKIKKIILETGKVSKYKVEILPEMSLDEFKKFIECERVNAFADGEDGREDLTKYISKT